MEQEALEDIDTNIASRSSRLGAVLIDGIIAMSFTFPAMSYFGVWEAMNETGVIPLDLTVKLAFVGIIFFFLLHGYLLYQYGQTIGKKLVGIRIVTMQGDKPEFLPLISKRYLPIWVISYIPLIGGYLAMIDALFIFRKDKRCIHDLIAGTMVVQNNASISSNDDVSGEAIS